MIVSTTRLRLRSWRYLVGFARDTLGSLRQAKAAAGCLDGQLLFERRRTFWTVTRWSSEAAMRAWRGSSAHARAMPHLLEWCDEASVVRWEAPEDAPFPTWEECHRRMVSQGRPSKVRHPSDAHRMGTGLVPTPRLGWRRPLAFKGAAGGASATERN